MRYDILVTCNSHYQSSRGRQHESRGFQPGTHDLQLSRHRLRLRQHDDGRHEGIGAPCRCPLYRGYSYPSRAPASAPDGLPAQGARSRGARSAHSLTHSRAILSGLSCPLLVERDSEGASVFRLAHELHHAVGPLDGVTHERESQARATTLA